MKYLNITLLAAVANANFDFLNNTENGEVAEENTLEAAVDAADATKAADAGLTGASDSQDEATNESAHAGLTGASDDTQAATESGQDGLTGASEDNAEAKEAVSTTSQNNILTGTIDTSDASTVPDSQPVDLLLNDAVQSEEVTAEKAVSNIVDETGTLSLNIVASEVDVDDADAANTLSDGLVDAIQDVHNAALNHVVDDAQISAAETTTECKNADLGCHINNAAVSIANALIDDVTGGEGEPTQASVDIAQSAQAEAAQSIIDFANSVVEDLRKAADYENMTEEDKAAFDEKIEEEAAAAKIFQDADRLAAGYEQMDAEAKTVYDAEMLKWVKKVAVDCNNPNSSHCLFAEKVREATTAARFGIRYYELSAEGREAWDDARAAENQNILAAQTNSWHEINVPAQGQLGSKCSQEDACLVKSHCCGTFTSLKDGDLKLQNRCHDTRLDIYTDDLGNTWSHQCGAQKLIAAATALFSIGALLM